MGKSNCCGTWHEGTHISWFINMMQETWCKKTVTLLRLSKEGAVTMPNLNISLELGLKNKHRKKNKKLNVFDNHKLTTFVTNDITLETTQYTSPRSITVFLYHNACLFCIKYILENKVQNSIHPFKVPFKDLPFSWYRFFKILGSLNAAALRRLLLILWVTLNLFIFRKLQKKKPWPTFVYLSDSLSINKAQGFGKWIFHLL